MRGRIVAGGLLLGFGMLAAGCSRTVADDEVGVGEPDALNPWATQFELAYEDAESDFVREVLRDGQITEAEAQSHPRKNLITRALGVGETLDVDYCEQELRPGDILLLCTDGLSNSVDLTELPAMLRQGGFETLAEQLVARANQNGGQDNITVVAIENNS